MSSEDKFISRESDFDRSDSPRAKPPKRLTAIAVKALKPGRKRREVSDPGAQGLFLVIQPSGAKAWALRFRRPNGKPAKLTLGTVDFSDLEPEGVPVLGTPLSLKSARALAAEIHRQRAAGRDVVARYSAEKRRRATEGADRAKRMFGALARRFIDEHARIKTRRWRYAARMLGLAYPPDGEDGQPAGAPTIIAGGLAHRWSDKPVDEIDADDIGALIDEACSDGVPGLEVRKKGASETRGLAMARCLSKLFSWLSARPRRYVTVNPCVGMEAPPAPAPRHRFLSRDELRWLWKATDQVGEPFGGLFRLLMFTGARRSEVGNMTWPELTPDYKEWHLPPERTKNVRPHVYPLSTAARELIAAVSRIEGKAGYLFTTNGKRPVSGYSKVKHRLDAKMLQIARKEAADSGRDPSEVSIQPWRIHDIRRSVVTHMAEIGLRPDLIELIVGHVSGHRAGVAGTYNRSERMDERRRALERWAAHIQAIVTESATNAIPTKVIPLRPGGR